MKLSCNGLAAKVAALGEEAVVHIRDVFGTIRSISYRFVDLSFNRPAGATLTVSSRLKSCSCFQNQCSTSRSITLGLRHGDDVQKCCATIHGGLAGLGSMHMMSTLHGHKNVL